MRTERPKPLQLRTTRTVLTYPVRMVHATIKQPSESMMGVRLHGVCDWTRAQHVQLAAQAAIQRPCGSPGVMAARLLRSMSAQACNNSSRLCNRRVIDHRAAVRLMGVRLHGVCDWTRARHVQLAAQTAIQRPCGSPGVMAARLLRTLTRPPKLAATPARPVLTYPVRMVHATIKQPSGSMMGVRLHSVCDWTRA